MDSLCGQYLTFRQFIECGETQEKTDTPNLPKQVDSYNALFDLALNVLDPVIDYFGMICLTYGFCSSELAKHIPDRIDPKRDQHSSYERNKRGKLICERLGAAVDFLVEDECMLEVAKWVVANTPFDRLYYYGDDSSGPHPLDSDWTKISVFLHDEQLAQERSDETKETYPFTRVQV